MLKLASDVLPQDSIQYLADGLENGIGASDAIPDPGVSVLCKNISGSTNFVREAPAVATPNQNPLEQALANIECSQLESACKVLEEAIYAHTSDLEQQALLLDLYRKTNNKTRFSAIYTNPGEAELLNQPAWNALANYFDLAR